jgi:hypothetical protein
MDPTFPVDLHPATSGSGSGGGGRDGSSNPNKMGDQIIKILGAAFVVLALLPAVLYTGHWVVSPLLYEVRLVHVDPISLQPPGFNPRTCKQ